MGRPRRGVGGAREPTEPTDARAASRTLQRRIGAFQGAAKPAHRRSLASHREREAPTVGASSAPAWMKARAREGFARAFSLWVPPRGWWSPEGIGVALHTSTLSGV